MEAQQTLRRPSNWQDFESLCKKLWGEIWNCPEIQKNGRLGQEQSGVDVFGIPFGENAFYGIQCKGKNEYNDNQFTKKEIDEEIEKAKSFEPELKKFYLATTAQNDSKIQAYVRMKNIEHIKKRLFEVHLFCWETIVDLIDENKQTYDYYVKSQGYKSNKSVMLTFHDDSTEITLKPKFKRTKIEYKQKKIPSHNMMNSHSAKFHRPQQTIVRPVVEFPIEKVNLSYSEFFLRIHNTGNEPIEEYKIFLQFEGEIVDLKDTNEVSDNFMRLISADIPNTYLWNDSMTGKIIPEKSILVGDDSFASDDIFIKTEAKETTIILKWKLISKDYKDGGDLTLNIKPDIKIIYKTIRVEDPLKVGLVEDEIEEVIINKNNI